MNTTERHTKAHIEKAVAIGNFWRLVGLVGLIVLVAACGLAQPIAGSLTLEEIQANARAEAHYFNPH